MSIQNPKQISDVKIMLKTGQDGVGIQSVQKTGTVGLVDTYTITFDDGRTATFTVTNGSSIASIQKTSTQGVVDTYTITMTDGSTSTFTVTNGEPASYPANKVTYDNTGTELEADDVQDAITEVADDLTADGLMFNFSKSGNAYGYLDGQGNFVPFKNPIGTKSITANGTYDVAEYASAEVNVPSQEPTGTKNITANGSYDVRSFATANVNVPVPTGTRNITANGNYDVSAYANANVSVPNTNSATYTPSANGTALDMGVNNAYRYVNTNNVYVQGQNNANITDKGYVTVSQSMAGTTLDGLSCIYVERGVISGVQNAVILAERKSTSPTNGYHLAFIRPTSAQNSVTMQFASGSGGYEVYKISS